MKKFINMKKRRIIAICLTVGMIFPNLSAFSATVQNPRGENIPLEIELPEYERDYDAGLPVDDERGPLIVTSGDVDKVELVELSDNGEPIISFDVSEDINVPPDDDDRQIHAIDFYAPISNRLISRNVEYAVKFTEDGTYTFTLSGGGSFRIGSNGIWRNSGDTVTLAANSTNGYYSILASGSGSCYITISKYVPPSRIDFYAPVTSYAMQRGVLYGLKTTSDGDYRFTVSDGGNFYLADNLRSSGEIRTLINTGASQYYKIQLAGTSGTGYITIQKYIPPAKEYFYASVTNKSITRGVEYGLRTSAEAVFKIVVGNGSNFTLGSSTYASGTTIKLGNTGASASYPFSIVGSGTTTVTIYQIEYFNVPVTNMSITKGKEYRIHNSKVALYSFTTGDGGSLQIGDNIYPSGTIRDFATVAVDTTFRRFEIPGSGATTITVKEVANNAGDFNIDSSVTLNRGTKYFFKPPVGAYYTISCNVGNINVSGNDKMTNNYTNWFEGGSSYSITISGSGSCTVRIDKAPKLSGYGINHSVQAGKVYEIPIDSHTAYRLYPSFGNVSMSGTVLDWATDENNNPREFVELSIDPNANTHKSRYVQVSASGTLRVERGGTATTVSSLRSLQTDYRVPGPITVYCPTTNDYYTQLTQAATQITSQTDFDVTVSTTNTSGAVSFSIYPDQTNHGKSHTNWAGFARSSRYSTMTNGWYDAKATELWVNRNKADNMDLRRVLTHELGHFAGLRDYKYNNFGQSDLGVGYCNWMMYGTDFSFQPYSFTSREVEAINGKMGVTRSASINDNTVDFDRSNLVEIITTMYYGESTLVEAVKESDYIVAGTIEAIGETETDGVHYYRLAKVLVSESLKSQNPSYVNIRLYGGEIDGIKYTYNIGPNYKVGDTIMAVLCEEAVSDDRGIHNDTIPECSIFGGNYSFEYDERSVSETAGNSLIIKAIREAVNNSNSPSSENEPIPENN